VGPVKSRVGLVLVVGPRLLGRGAPAREPGPRPVRDHVSARGAVPGGRLHQGLARGVPPVPELYWLLSVRACAGVLICLTRRSNAENFRDVVAIHVRRLRAGLYLEGVANPAREASFRFDVSVLDKAGFEFAFDNNGALGQCFLDTAVNDATSHENVILPPGMDT